MQRSLQSTLYNTEPCGSLFSKKETNEAQLTSNSDPSQLPLGRYDLCQELAKLGSLKLPKPLSWTEVQPRKTVERNDRNKPQPEKRIWEVNCHNGRPPRRIDSKTGAQRNPLDLINRNCKKHSWSYSHPSTKLSTPGPNVLLAEKTRDSAIELTDSLPNCLSSFLP